jgi:hypothetical protein
MSLFPWLASSTMRANRLRVVDERFARIPRSAAHLIRQFFTCLILLGTLAAGLASAGVPPLTPSRLGVAGGNGPCMSTAIASCQAQPPFEGVNWVAVSPEPNPEPALNESVYFHCTLPGKGASTYTATG